VDIDAYASAHQPTWRRLAVLARRAGRRRGLTGHEADEFVEAYQRTATHLSVIRSRTPDPYLVDRLSTLVARSRTALTGTKAHSWRDVATFWTVSFPAAMYRARRWWVSTAAAFLLVSVAVGTWIATHPRVQASIAAPEEVRQLVEQDFANYYSEHPASAFAAQVWTNNALVAAGSLCLGVLLLPTVFILWQNALNVGLAGGLMGAHGKLDIFFGLILPHGLLELTAVFVAAGTGLRLGWTLIDPGPLRRSEALSREGRAAVGIALGLVGVLLISGVIEGFVTPSGLPTAARLAIGIAAEVAFIAYVWVLGGRAARSGQTGDDTGLADFSAR
jgi:uncharacterized membrane protein SpoIIM required for sporulation